MNAQSAARTPHIKGIHPASGMSWRLSVKNSVALQFLCLLCYSIVKVLVKASEIKVGFCL